LRWPCREFSPPPRSRLFNLVGDLTYPLCLTHNVAIAVLFAPPRMDSWLLPLRQKSVA